MNDYRNRLYQQYNSSFKGHTISSPALEILSRNKHYDKQFLPKIKEYEPGCKILEIGCGPGTTIDYLKSRGYLNIIGIDISPEQIEIAKQKGHNVYIEDIFEFFKMNRQTYDIIIALDVVEHFSKEEVSLLFEEIRSHLQDEGMFLIRTPNGEGLLPNKIIYGDFTHLTIFSPNSLMQILKITGFQRVLFYETGPIAKDLKGLLRVILWKIIKKIVNGIKTIESGKEKNIWTQDFICFAYIKN